MNGKDKLKQARIRGRRWQFIRKMVLDDNPLCVVCERPAQEIDHIVPLYKGGTNDRENLQPLCIECHKDKTRQDAGKGAGVGLDGIPLDGW